jgi:hypothetical protein
MRVDPAVEVGLELFLVDPLAHVLYDLIRALLPLVNAVVDLF